MSNKFQSIEDTFQLARTNKKLNSNYQRVHQALKQLVEATCNAPSLTTEQQKALDSAIIALQYKL